MKRFSWINYFVSSLRCDSCEAYQYGFSSDGCKQCDCDASGSKGFQCDEYGQCPCNENVEGRRCDRCKENKYDRHIGCVDCPHCYNLVQDAADSHREKLNNLSSVLAEIASKPTVIDDAEFDSKLRVVEEKINILMEDAKAGAGGEDRTLLERLNDLNVRLDNVRDILDKSDELQETASQEVERANVNVTKADDTINKARRELTVNIQDINNCVFVLIKTFLSFVGCFGVTSNYWRFLAKQSQGPLGSVWPPIRSDQWYLSWGTTYRRFAGSPIRFEEGKCSRSV